MDLQDIKKEIESLRKETFTSTSNSNSEYIFGFTKIKLFLVFLISALLVYSVKPIYIFDFTCNDKKEINRVINYKRLVFIYLITLTLTMCIMKYASFPSFS
jgi:hypothetical protein